VSPGSGGRSPFLKLRAVDKRPRSVVIVYDWVRSFPSFRGEQVEEAVCLLWETPSNPVNDTENDPTGKELVENEPETLENLWG
jgi:hypothetical protein